MTTVRDQACFGIYADRQALPDVAVLARDIDNAITELLACVDPTVTPGPWLKPLRITAHRLAPLAQARERSVGAAAPARGRTGRRVPTRGCGSE